MRSGSFLHPDPDPDLHPDQILADSMSLPDTEKEKSLASGEAEDVIPQEGKQAEGSFKDYLVREAL